LASSSFLAQPTPSNKINARTHEFKDRLEIFILDSLQPGMPLPVQI
jgi:hypothetical protein